MFGLMLPAWVEGHASIPAMGSMFALFAWAAVAGACTGRERYTPAGEGRPHVIDPFSMALLMALPYVPFLMNGHGHHSSASTSGSFGSTGITAVLGTLLIVCWLCSRIRRGRRWAADPSFWMCFASMVTMMAHLESGL